MLHPGVEPESPAWEAEILTVGPMQLIYSLHGTILILEFLTATALVGLDNRDLRLDHLDVPPRHSLFVQHFLSTPNMSRHHHSIAENPKQLSTNSEHSCRIRTFKTTFHRKTKCRTKQVSKYFNVETVAALKFVSGRCLQKDTHPSS